MSEKKQVITILTTHEIKESYKVQAAKEGFGNLRSWVVATLNDRVVMGKQKTIITRKDRYETRKIID